MGKIQDLFGNEVVGCRSPIEIQNGADNIVHRCPLDCSETPEQIVKDCTMRLKYLRRRIWEVTQLKEKYFKKLNK